MLGAQVLWIRRPLFTFADSSEAAASAGRPGAGMIGLAGYVVQSVDGSLEHRIASLVLR